MVKVRDDLPILGNRKTLSQPLVDDTHDGVIDLVSWLAKLANNLQQDSLPRLEQACALVKRCVDSGGDNSAVVSGRSNVYSAGIGISDILSHLHVGEDVLVAGLLFRSVRQALISVETIETQFGKEVGALVAGAAAMGRLSELIEQNRRMDDTESIEKETSSSVYKMLISVTEDVRVVLIKLAERTFAIRELEHASSERKRRVASEILNIYAPLAHRLGIAQLKWELEDLAFRYLFPERYKEIAKLLSEKRAEREQHIQDLAQLLKHKLAEQGVQAEVLGRVKHIYSIYRKMQDKHLSFNQLYDIRALRVLVNDVSACYQALGVVHQLWRHIPNQFDDYITNPKGNGYRSLHTAVIADNKSLEVQIRTETMHHEAEIGVCAHFNYKEGETRTDYDFQHKLYSLRNVLEAYQESHGEEGNGYDDDDVGRLQEWGELEKIYVFTRDGDIRELSRDATVLDFAYHVHTQVGNRCYAAKVNQRFVPLNFKLKTGQQVEVITRDDQEPSRDWLINSLGYINTVHARDKLRTWFKHQAKSKNLEIGRDILSKELARLAIHPNSVDLAEYTTFFRVKTGDDILVGLVTGEISLSLLMNQINQQMSLDSSKETQAVFRAVLSKAATLALTEKGILTDTNSQVAMHHAFCCTPQKDVLIAGYITAHRGVSIHATSCSEFKRLAVEHPENVVDAYWEELSSAMQSVTILVTAYDRRGLLKDVTSVVFIDQINIRSVNTLTGHNGISELKLQIDVKGLAQLSRLLARIEQVPSVMSARRLVA